MSEYNGKLHETVVKFPNTDIWNDSCAEDELKYAIERGAVGATTNPVIVGNVLKKELPLWESTIKQFIADMPTATEDDIAWALIEEMARQRSKLLMPIFEKYNGEKGRLSIQTNAKYYRNAEKMAEQAVHLASLAPNMQVKMPTSKAGIEAFEEATFRGVSINATVSFTVAQAVAVAEAVERGLKRREEAGLPIDNISPICTIMIGRTDDWCKKSVSRDGICVDPEILEWCGVAAFKHAYAIFKERAYRTRLLTAAYRNHHHWSEFIGGDCSMTIPHNWQVIFNNSNIDVKETFSNPIPDGYLEKLLKDVPEFVKAYDEKALKEEDFEYYGAFRDTIGSFLAGYDELVVLIRSYMVPNTKKFK